MATRLTRAQMMAKADKIVDYYDYLQQQGFYAIVDTFKGNDYLLKQAADDPDKILEWRLQSLSQTGALTDKVINMLSMQLDISKQQIYRIIKNDGLKVAKQMNRQLARALKTPVKDVSKNTMKIIDSYAKQTFRGMNNYVNESLISTNYRKNTVARTYRDIINKTVLQVQTGTKTPERALYDTIYQWRDSGMKSNLTDKGGHNWSLEGYARQVITTETSRTYNDVRMDSMDDNDVVLAVMTSHPAARPACAPIQGQVVCTVDHDDDRCDEDYPNIYDYDYGEPGGCFGINCEHMLFPYIKGVSHNYQEDYDPDEAVENAKIQQKQRYYERSVRKNKYKLELAKRLGDDDGIKSAQQSISGYQSKIRQIVKDNDFLTRQRDREQIVTGG